MNRIACGTGIGLGSEEIAATLIPAADTRSIPGNVAGGLYYPR